MVKLKSDILSKVFYKDTLDEINNNELLSNIINDVPILESLYFYSCFNIISALVNFILGIVALMYLNYIIGLIVIVLSIILQIAPKIAEKKLRLLKYIYSEYLGEFTGKVKEALLGLRVIRSFSVEKNFLNNLKEVITLQESKKYKFNFFYCMTNNIFSLLGFFIFTSTISISSYLVIKKQITIGTMIAAIQLINNITSPLQQITSSINNLNSSRSVEKKITSILNEEVVNRENYLKDAEFEEIDLDNVSFSYEKNKKILNRINIKIEKGEKIAIVGPSGSGKNTLLKLISSEIKPDEGKVKLNNKDIFLLSKKEISKFIARIDQDIFLFDTSIKNNISLYSEDIKDEDIEYWSNKLKINEMLENFDMSIDTVGENGEKLSGGQKQQIAILRALVRNTPILVLDEINSSIDNRLSFKIEEVLLGLKDITIVSVTHKMNKNILKLYDNIIVLKDNEISEMGNFDFLMNKEGYLFNICSLQQ